MIRFVIINSINTVTYFSFLDLSLVLSFLSHLGNFLHFHVLVDNCKQVKRAQLKDLIGIEAIKHLKVVGTAALLHCKAQALFLHYQPHAVSNLFQVLSLRKLLLFNLEHVLDYIVFAGNRLCVLVEWLDF